MSKIKSTTQSLFSFFLLLLLCWVYFLSYCYYSGFYFFLLLVFLCFLIFDSAEFFIFLFFEAVTTWNLLQLVKVTNKVSWLNDMLINQIIIHCQVQRWFVYLMPTSYYCLYDELCLCFIFRSLHNHLSKSGTHKQKKILHQITLWRLPGYDL